MYQPFPREKFEGLDRNLWFQELVEHIRPHAESSPYMVDLARIANLPREAGALYFLWMFYCEVGGNGLDVFLLQPLGIFAPHVHKALKLVGASELVERLEAAIPHALVSGSAEFTESPEVSWFEQFSANPKYPTLQSVDVDIYDLANDDLQTKVNAFIEAHKHVLLA